MRRPGLQVFVRRVPALLVVVLAFASGCFAPESTVCANGGVCPAGLVCVAVGDRDLCALPSCGNGVVDNGEACDDGNATLGDSCSPICSESCGDTIVDGNAGETCDDGNAVDGDGCSQACTTEACGNGFVDIGEACDDGNLQSHDDCSSRCTIETLAWRATDETPLTNPQFALAYDSMRGTIVMVGGPYQVANQLSETWEWNSRWRKRLTTTAPPLRRRPAMTFDRHRGRVVLYGGEGRFDLWEWDGWTWTERVRQPTEEWPDVGTNTAMVYEDANRRVVLFGGQVGEGGALGTGATWSWDGTRWAKLPTTTNPPNRHTHAMAYDRDREAIVLFGGKVESGALANDTWEFNGATWRPRQAAGVGGREYHSMAYDERRRVVVMMDGFGVEETAEWDGTLWRSIADAPKQTSFAYAPPTLAIYDGRSERVVHFGASQDSLAAMYLRNRWTWDGLRWQLDPNHLLAAPPTTSEAVLVSFGERVVFAGADLQHPPQAWLWTGGGWISTPQIPPQPAPRLAASWVGYRNQNGGDAIMMLGGRDANGSLLSDGWVLVQGGWQIQDLPTTLAPRAGAGLAPLPFGGVMLFGGIDRGGGPSNDTWLNTEGMFVLARPDPSPQPPPRHSPVMALDEANGRVVMVGGIDDNGFVDDAWQWDGSWSPLPTPPITAIGPRGLVYDRKRSRIVLVHDHLWDLAGDTWIDRGPSTLVPGSDRRSAAYDAKLDRIVVLRRRGAYGADVGTLEWTGSAWVDGVTGLAIPGARTVAAATYDPARRRAWLFGGATSTEYQPAAPFGDLWQWDGSRWSGATSDGRAERRGASFVFDESRDVSLLLAGLAETGDTSSWTWDGATWQSLDDAAVAPTGYMMATAYDAARHQVVVLGGTTLPAGPENVLDTFYLWDGSWTIRPTISTPAKRYAAAMAFDRARERVVLFGGRDNTMIAFDDLWEWDGTVWTRREPTGARPSHRSHHAVVWDERRRKIIVFGGTHIEGSLADTWEWDGTTWRQLEIVSPGGRVGPTLVNDPRGGLVLFGGSSDSRVPAADRRTWILRADDASLPLESCLPGLDSDGDGKVACDDPDCACQ